MRVLACLSAFFLFIPLASAETILLEFSAKWCPPCRDMEPVVAALEREGYRVQRINADPRTASQADQAKSRQFKVQNIPTFVALTDGRETGRLVGAVPAESLRRLLGPVAATRTTQPTPQASESPAEMPLADSSRTGRVADRELIRRSVRITVEDAKSRSFGTGTVVRSIAGETLILTCGHLFQGVSRGAKTTVEFLGSSDKQRLPAELVARDGEADLSLIRVITNQALPAAPVASRDSAPAAGMSALSVGCNQGGPPTVRQTRVTAINRYLGAPTIECSGEPVEGRSGGGLFNESGALIGVCSAREPSERRGIYGGLAAIQALLDRQGLASLYDSKVSRDVVALAKAQSGKPARNPLTLPSPEELGLKVQDDWQVPEGIDQAEVVCVIRSLDDPKAAARVVVLNRASQEFLSLLEKEQAAQGTRSNTAMRLPTDLNARSVERRPADPAAMSAPTRDSSGWRAAGSSAAEFKAKDQAIPMSGSAIQEAAKWEKDWPPGANSADGPVRR